MCCDPSLLPPHETRWTLRTLGTSVSWLNGMSIPGVRSVPAISASVISVATLMRAMLSISKNSPLSNKLSKLRNIQKHTLVNQDEFSFRRQPTVAKDWTLTGTKHPLAHQRSMTIRPAMAALNAHTGDLVYQPSATVVATHALYSEICLRYPNAERIFLIQGPDTCIQTYWQHCQTHKTTELEGQI